MRIIRRWWPWLAAASSGGLLVFCFEPWNQEWLCWIALAPLLAAIWSAPNPPGYQPGLAGIGVNVAARPRWFRPKFLRQRWVRGFAMGYVTGLIFIWGAFYWLTQVTEPGWFILAPYMGLYCAVWGAFMATVGRPWDASGSPSPPASGRSLGRPGSGALFVWNPAPASGSALLRSRWNLWFAFLGACAWTGLEWVRGWLLSGFGWNDLGVALHGNVPFLQIAEWTGVGGLSFLAAFVNVIAVATVGRFVLEVRAHRVRPHFDFTLTVAAVMIVFTFGLRTMRTSIRESERPGAVIPLRVTAIQPGILQAEKWEAARAEGIYKVYGALSETAMATHPQLLLWPEAATPYGMYDSRWDTVGFTFGVASRGKCSLLLGTLDYDFGPDGRAQADYNAAMLITPGIEHVQTYRKIHLVPFGEYVPYRKSFPPLAWIVGDQVPGDFAAGTEAVVFDLADPPVRLGPLICFEDTLGRLARQPVLLGAQVLVNLTNDAWFGHTAASRQQLAESVFRAVENRRPLVRCANTGVTAFVDRHGRVIQRLTGADGSIFTQGILAGVVQVPTHPALTFYTRHGEVFSAGCAGVACLAAFIASWLRLRKLEIGRRRAGVGSQGEGKMEALQPVP